MKPQIKLETIKSNFTRLLAQTWSPCILFDIESGHIEEYDELSRLWAVLKTLLISDIHVFLQHFQCVTNEVGT